MADTTETMDGIDLLMSDHRRIETLFSQVGTRGSEAGQEEVARKIIEELSVHAAIEEQVLYPTVRRELPDGDALAEHSLEEHQEVKETLAQIESVGPGSAEAASLLTGLRSSFREHVQEEESQMFPKLRESLSSETIQAMGDAMAKAKKLAPTHPHPKAPSTPPGNVVAGPAAAVADKVRDALRRD